MSIIKWSTIKQIEVFFFEKNVMVRRFVSCRASGILCLTGRVLRDECHLCPTGRVLWDEWHLCPTGRVLRDEWHLRPIGRVSFMSYGMSPTGRVLRDEWHLCPTGRVAFTLSKSVSIQTGENFSETECDGRGF